MTSLRTCRNLEPEEGEANRGLLAIDGNGGGPRSLLARILPSLAKSLTLENEKSNELLRRTVAAGQTPRYKLELKRPRDATERAQKRTLAMNAARIQRGQ